MTERKVKRNFFAFIMKALAFDREKNAERLNDTDEQTIVSSSRKTFFCNALRLQLIVATSNDAIDETQRSEDHASLLSYE
jgi:hypothetical protein